MAPTLLTHALLMLAAAQTPATPPTAPIVVPRWSSYEMTLTATGQYTSPYVSVDLVGVFTAPNGQGVVVKGFWDGGQTFRIRFTPTVEGTWTFATVSDDPGLDGHEGTITCVKPTEGTHGFVRQVGKVRGNWIYDDGSAVGGEAIPVTVRANIAQCGGDGAPCANSDAAQDYVDVARLQEADHLVMDALAGRRLAEIVLFDVGDPWTIDPSHMYRYIEYMAARYGSFANVIWCLHPTTSGSHARAFWDTSRNLVQTLDPAFFLDSRSRVLRAECTPPS